jgi:Mn-dependent DtxR family transcriptional regulator
MGNRLMKISKEDYLEAILICTKKFGACRVTDVAAQLGHSKASVSVALSKLEAEGLVIKDDWRILLSDSGKAFAEKILERHIFFLKWFEHIGIDDKTAKEDACLIEHAISDATFEKILIYLKKLDKEL